MGDLRISIGLNRCSLVTKTHIVFHRVAVASRTEEPVSLAGIRICRTKRTQGDMPMKKLLLMSAAASLLATATFAQTTVTTTTGTAGGAVQIEPQYRTKIKSYVTEHKIAP